MARKHNDAPLKLIHILPQDDPSNLYDPLPARLKVQIGIEGTRPIWIKFAHYVSRFRAGRRLASRGDRPTPPQPRRWAAWLIAVGKHMNAGLLFLLQTMRRGGILFYRAVAKLGQVSGRMVHWMMSQVNRVKMAWTKPSKAGESSATESSETTQAQKQEILQELITLKGQLMAQQDELTRVGAQMRDLKAMVLSQQQGLLHLAEELDEAVMKAVPSTGAHLGKPGALRRN